MIGLRSPCAWTVHREASLNCRRLAEILVGVGTLCSLSTQREVGLLPLQLVWTVFFSSEMNFCLEWLAWSVCLQDIFGSVWRWFGSQLSHRRVVGGGQDAAKPRTVRRPAPCGKNDGPECKQYWDGPTFGIHSSSIPIMGMRTGDKRSTYFYD